jgi:hypothetical protein
MVEHKNTAVIGRQNSSKCRTLRYGMIEQKYSANGRTVNSSICDTKITV